MSTVLEAPEKVVVTTPGVYDMPADVYHADPIPRPGRSLSSSGARRLMATCPAKYIYEADHPKKPTKPMELGTAAHKLVLGIGPELVLVDHEKWNTNAVKAEVAEIREQGALPLKREDWDTVHAMAGKIRENELAAALLGGTGAAEQALFWQDGPTKIWRRAMLDWLPPKGPDGRLYLADYKGLALDTAIPTPDGWTTIAALRVGDRVFDGSGRPCSVVAKSEIHQRKCYRMRFDDGSSVICDDEHLWITTSGQTGQRLAPMVRTTEEIRQTLTYTGQHHHRIPVAGPLDLPEVELPIHPYVFGCWLGDGTTSEGRITKPDEELFARIADCGYRVGAPSPSDKVPTRTVYGLRTQLRKAGLLGRKVIPDAYQRASDVQRLNLLRGLMDTDGSWNARRQQAVFTSTDKGLALAVRELACSLGQRAVLHTATQHGFGLTVEAYQVTFTPIRGLNPFALSRKAEQVAVRSEAKSRRRLVVAVEETLTVPTQCIAVDSPDHTYLCTESMIPTHNTAESAHPDAISKSLVNFGYHQQGAWYEDAVKALGLSDDVPYFLVVQEKTPPYLVSVVQLTQIALDAGRHENRKAIRLFAQCMKTGVWPPYVEGVAQVGLPGWAENKFLQEVTP